MNYPEGSQWRKWDLHVHTPDSLVEHYAGTSKKESWERFINELEQLPDEFKVIGINDYIFLDGYKEVLKYKEAGRLQNIDLFLPVIELRLDKFGGTNSKLSRVNYHIIFSNEIKPEIIEAQFLNSLSRKYILSSDYQKLQWQAIPTKESIAELGRMIKETVPQERRSEFKSDLEEGFNNINFNKEKVIEALESHYFRGKYLTAIGKTEWYDIKWNDQSIGDKKDIINDSDFVFISAESVDKFQKSKDSLTEASVNNLLLDCSDAHYFSDSKEKDRLGKCFTWLKADTTFEGLKQILNEKEERVFIGDLPPKLNKVQTNKTKYIKALHINKREDAKENDIWFDNQINFNSNLIAIIGNKGNGKSALADIAALVGNTKNYEEFSFLTKNKFRKSNLAKNFEAKIIWESTIEEDKISLDSNPDPAKLEKVKYLPQQFLEKLCNDESKKFESELKKVIFSHVSEEDKLNKSTLDDLIEHNSTTIMQSINITQNQVVNINKKIVKFENQTKESYLKALQENIKSTRQQLFTHDNSKPQEEKDSTSNPDIQKHLTEINITINKLNEEKGKLLDEIEAKQEKLNKNKLKLAACKRLNESLDNFEKQFKILKEELTEELSLLDLLDNQIVSLNIERAIINGKQKEFEADNNVLSQQLSTHGEFSLFVKKKTVEDKIISLQNQLDEPNKRYQVYVSALKQWEFDREQIVGDKQKAGTLVYYENELEYIKSELPAELQKLKQEREEKSREIFTYISRLVSELEKLYEPVQNYFFKHKLSDPEFQLNFEVILNASGFIDGFLSFINQAVKGNFNGSAEGRKIIVSLLEEIDFKNANSVLQFLNQILDLLEEKQDKSQKFEIENQLKKSFSKEDLYNYIFSLEYLTPSYGLKLGDKELSKLSPGEKGALLLMFYLLVDKDDIPLIIDQPEENLDNQSVFNMLVPAIKAAKNHRQIIMVTLTQI